MVSVCVGLGFGDEGKGLVTNYLASHQPNALNIRFNGGHQAGHTVVEKGVRHVFSNFGAGTMQGLNTYWSKHCTVDPVGLMKELTILRQKGFDPTIYIHDECPITTPMDKALNQNFETDAQHGSCGVGFGVTIAREEDYYSLKFRDIFYPAILAERLKNITKDYFGDDEDYPDIDMSEFLEACEAIRRTPTIFRAQAGPLSGGFAVEDFIFEGAQGLLLDQHYGFFPNVTRSNTGSQNIAHCTAHAKWYLVTRAYQTRHGNGFMTNEALPHNIEQNPLETNVTNKYQGAFRRSLLDVDLLEYAISRDKVIAQAEDRTLVITCMDHIKNECRFTHRGEIVHCSDRKDFARRVAALLGINEVLMSFSDDGSSIAQL